MKKYQIYEKYIKKNVLPYIDYKKLQESYGTEEKQYAKIVLKSLTEAAKKIYGNKIACRGRLDFVIVPGVIVSRKTRNVCVVLLGLDLTSAGDHCSTDFLTKYGNVLQGHEADEQIQKFISEMYIPYQYTYTLPIIGDIHCLTENQPEELREMLSSFELMSGVLDENEGFSKK